MNVNIMAALCNVPHNFENRFEGDLQTLLIAMWDGVEISAVGVISNAMHQLFCLTGIEGMALLNLIGVIEKTGQIYLDYQTDEIWIREWLEWNYLMELTESASPSRVIEAFEAIRSDRVRLQARNDIVRFDIRQDADMEIRKHKSS